MAIAALFVIVATVLAVGLFPVGAVWGGRTGPFTSLGRVRFHRHDVQQSGARAFAELHGNFYLFAATIDRNFHFVSRTLLVQNKIYVKLRRDFLAVDCGNQVAADIKSAHAQLCDAVAAANARLRRWAAARNSLHQQAFLDR